MDGDTHIFGKGKVNPNEVFKFVAITLELSDIRVSCRNFKPAAKRLADVENAMIGLAQGLGITIPEWKEATAKVLAARQLQKKKLKVVKDEEVKDETPSPA